MLTHACERPIHVTTAPPRPPSARSGSISRSVSEPSFDFHRPRTAGCTHAGPLAALQDADRVPAGPRAVGVGLRPRRHRPRGLAGCSPRCRRETARSAMVGPAKCMVKLRCAWSRWRAGAMRQRHEALAVSLSHSRSVLAPAHLRGDTSSRVSHRVCGPRCRQVALLLGVCLGAQVLRGNCSKRRHMRWLAAAGSRRHLSHSPLSFVPTISVSWAAFLRPPRLCHRL